MKYQVSLYKSVVHIGDKSTTDATVNSIPSARKWLAGKVDWFQLLRSKAGWDIVGLNRSGWKCTLGAISRIK